VSNGHGQTGPVPQPDIILLTGNVSVQPMQVQQGSGAGVEVRVEMGADNLKKMLGGEEVVLKLTGPGVSTDVPSVEIRAHVPDNAFRGHSKS
jgi:hypothetical protein